MIRKVQVVIHILARDDNHEQLFSSDTHDCLALDKYNYVNKYIHFVNKSIDHVPAAYTRIMTEWFPTSSYKRDESIPSLEVFPRGK